MYASTPLPSADSSLARDGTAFGGKASLASTSSSNGDRATASKSREAPSISLNGTAMYTAGGQQNKHQDAPGDPNASAEEGELWSSILNSVTSSRATPVKNVIVLGQTRTGKSTLLTNLASSSPSGFVSDVSLTSSEVQSSPDPSIGPSQPSGQIEFAHSVHKTVSADLGLGYGYFDVGDEDEEDIVGRVGVYQVNSSHPASLSLLPFALLGRASATGPDNHDEEARTDASDSARGTTSVANSAASLEGLRESLFLIVLDWEAPWDFLSQLVEWLDVIRDVVERVSESRGSHSSSDSPSLEQLKENLESYIRHYSEPSAAANGSVLDVDDVGETSTASAIVAVSNPTGVVDDERTPLPQGCLTHNFGVPIVVVCTKADTISQLERQRNFKEEQFDYIQQVLRTICLKYGAGLFSTAQSRPQSFDILRQYLLHRLFASSRQHSATGAFHFRHRASTVERDVLLVPAGWDSFGKIRALREGFDCASTANGWEWDTQVERIRRQRKLSKGDKEAEDQAEEEVDRRLLPGLVDSDGGGVGSALKQYEDIVEDWDVSAPIAVTSNARVKELDDQVFLQHQYTILQREPETRTRGARGVSSNVSNAPGTTDSGPRSIVGPLGSASLSLPTVERAMQDRQTSDDTLRSGGGQSVTAKPAARRETALRGGDVALRHEPVANSSSGRGTPTALLRGGVASPSATQSPSLTSSDRGGSRPTSPSGTGAMSPSNGTPKQSEVLHSFFQSLLKEKPASGGGSTAALGRSSQPGGRSGSSQNGVGRS